MPTDYFLPKEFKKIIAPTDKYEYGGGNDNQQRARRMRVLTLLMRWLGLAILDATSDERMGDFASTKNDRLSIASGLPNSREHQRSIFRGNRRFSEENLE